VPTFSGGFNDHFHPAAMSNDKTTLGKISLWTAIGGIVVPVVLAAVVLVVVLFLTPQRERAGPQYAGEGLVALALCGILLVILELVALVCGIVARHTTTGKVGVTISVVSLTLAVGMTAFVFSS
jgi:hypothetical protein